LPNISNETEIISAESARMMERANRTRRSGRGGGCGGEVYAFHRLLRRPSD
jgi:hypothetical protein